MLSTLRTRGAVALISRQGAATLAQRAYSQREHLIDTLLHNPELDAGDVCNELRWMQQAVPASLPPGQAATVLEDMVVRRSEGEPLQYILGNTDFGELTLLTRAPVLIPRPETAFIVEEVARRVRAARAAHMGPVRPLNVLDLCTGSGCIPLLLSRLLGDAVGSVIGVDISGDAVALARDNIAAVGDTRVRVIQADMLSPDFVARLAREAGGTPFDLITANPPYIPADEYAELPRSVRAYEDRGALLAGPVEGVGEGVAFYAHIARLASHVLAPAESVPQGMPRVAVEIGAEQGEAVSRLLLGNTHVVKDQYGLDRMVLSVL